MTYVIALIAGYFGLLVVLSLMARPSRARLESLMRDLSADYPHDEMVAWWCDKVKVGAYSWRTAPMVFLAFLLGIIMPLKEIDQETERLERDSPSVRDPRNFEVMDRFLASAAAVNPLFGVLMYCALLGFQIRAIAHFRSLRRRPVVELVGLRA